MSDTKAVEEILVLLPDINNPLIKFFVYEDRSDPSQKLYCTNDDGVTTRQLGKSVRLSCKIQSDLIKIDQVKMHEGEPFCAFAVYNMPHLKLGTDITAVYTSTAENANFISATLTVRNVMKSVIDQELDSVDYVVFELASDKKVDKISIVCPSSGTPDCSGISVVLLKASNLVMTTVNP